MADIKSSDFSAWSLCFCTENTRDDGCMTYIPPHPPQKPILCVYHSRTGKHIDQSRCCTLHMLLGNCRRAEVITCERRLFNSYFTVTKLLECFFFIYHIWFFTCSFYVQVTIKKWSSASPPIHFNWARSWWPKITAWGSCEDGCQVARPAEKDFVWTSLKQHYVTSLPKNKPFFLPLNHFW